MKNKRERPEEVEVEGEEVEVDEKKLKKEKIKAAAERRRQSRKKDKVARWGGMILLGLIMLTGFCLWVLGEIRQEDQAVREQTIIVR